MINLFNKYKLLIILSLVIVVVVFVVSARRKSPPSPNLSSSPTPSIAPFELISVFPPPGEQETPIGNLALQFTFTRPIEISSVSIKIEPKIDFNYSTSEGGKTLNIYPVDNWRYNRKYSVTIKAVDSKDGQSISAPIEYSFTPVPLINSPLTE